jgi:pathogenesis-related protein 1
MIDKISAAALCIALLSACSTDDIKKSVDDFKDEYTNDEAVVDETTHASGVDRNISVSGQKKALVDAHNEARAQVGITEKLVWSEKLAQDAQSYANTLSASGNWEHDPKNHQGYSHGPYGENLYVSSSKSTLLDASDAWVNERRYYHFGKIGESSTCDSGAICGHYTQIIWKKTKEVGCASSVYQKGQYKDWYLTVCKYKVPGNFIGQTPY